MKYPLLAVIGTAALLSIVPALAAPKLVAPFWERGITGMASGPIGSDATASTPAADDALANAEVTVSDLLEAGFTAPEPVQPRADVYRLPTYYFRVQETSHETAWSQPPNDAANLVAVLVQPLTASEAVSLPLNKVEYKEIFGRFQARTYRNGRYLVVTGPDGDRVSNLMKLLENKKF